MSVLCGQKYMSGQPQSYTTRDQAASMFAACSWARSSDLIGTRCSHPNRCGCTDVSRSRRHPMAAVRRTHRGSGRQTGRYLGLAASSGFHSDTRKSSPYASRATAAASVAFLASTRSPVWSKKLSCGHTKPTYSRGSPASLLTHGLSPGHRQRAYAPTGGGMTRPSTLFERRRRQKLCGSNPYRRAWRIRATNMCRPSGCRRDSTSSSTAISVPSARSTGTTTVRPSRGLRPLLR